MSYSFQNPSDEVIESYLKSAKTIAIVGLSHRKEAAFSICCFCDIFEVNIYTIKLIVKCSRHNLIDQGLSLIHI